MTGALFWMTLTAGILIGIFIGGAVIARIYRANHRRILGEAWIHYPRATDDETSEWGYGGTDRGGWRRS